MLDTNTRKDRVIAQLEELTAERFAADEAERVAQFLRHFYENVPPVDMLAESPENLFGGALHVWHLVQHRPPGQAKICSYRPRVEEHGWKSSHTVIEIVNDDMPFLVDSVVGAISLHDVPVHLVVHPIYDIGRDAEGHLLRIESERAVTGAGMRRESVMQVQISDLDDAQTRALVATVERALDDVRAAVEDWEEMRSRLRQIVAELGASPPALLSPEEVGEGAAFLEWLDSDYFIYLGYREYRYEGESDSATARIVEGQGLGLLRDPEVTVFDGLRDLGALPPEIRSFVNAPVLLRITKSHHPSTVHRPVRMDTVAVKIFDDAGRVVGERLFVGLLTSDAYSLSPRHIPVLRRTISNILARAGYTEGTHNANNLRHILENHPRDELFQATEDELLETSVGILHLQGRQRTALFVRRDPFERFVSCLVYVPRDRYDTALRKRIESILAESFMGEVVTFYTHLTDSPLARLHFIVRVTPGTTPRETPEQIEAHLIEASRGWDDQLVEALIEEHGEATGERLARRFAAAFPAGYKAQSSVQAAVVDIERMEETIRTNQLSMNLYRAVECRPHEVRFKIYLTGERARLSAVVPMLENMGLEVIDERPYDIRPTDLDLPVWIRDFALVTSDDSPVDVAAVREAFQETFGLVWAGEMEDDGFNKLVLHAGLEPREVLVLRAYARFLRQARIPFGQTYMHTTLRRNPRIVRALVDLFLARFDPDRRRPEADAAARSLVTEIEQQLDLVANLDEDRILRRFLNAIGATLRTNYFQTGAGGRAKSYLSIKLDSQALDGLPAPRPWREIFVFSARVEAVHLRGGRVARGGIRWSDRREDFRTEVLGLMKAQMVKNAVIVPVGSKGGFIVQRPPSGREALQAEVAECYRIMIRGLLDLTDNLVGEGVVPPDRVVRYDGNDPYLVVAADKGTATFSDIANAISAEYGFWLDDAFASGGSAGYDHKGMAITARGAWESVKRHFREMGRDTQRDSFTVVGVGDMSGDVFGNGMLLSPHIHLLGAFNHQHVFVDPAPDPAVSLAERQRLFALPRSSWADYDPTLISAGGGVFERAAKSIPVSPEMRARFGLGAAQVTPNDLIRALLRADVDLLWFGGIGTYVKASDESHQEVDDRANDALRIDATEVRARVIGEGANLALTQRGRIQLGLRGGRLNTDSIDNSAGVDCSDHEVNIKILLGGVEQAGDLTRKQRNELLREMTDEVAALVLRDNYLQTQAITVTHGLSAHLLDRVARFMRALERRGRLDRRIERLPDDEQLAERLQKGLGFARPELAVLMAYAKIDLYSELLGSDLPEDPYLAEDLRLYFPAPLRQRLGDDIGRHRLRREIIATMVTNGIINRVGLAFVHEVRERTGMMPADVARAYLISREVFGMRDLWQAIEGLDNAVPAALQAGMLVECGRLIERTTVWFLRDSGSLADIGGRITAYQEGVQELAARLPDLLSESDKHQMAQRVRDLVVEGAPPELAHRTASLRLLGPACDIVRLAAETGLSVEKVGVIYFIIGSRYGLDWLRRTAMQLPTDTAWDKQASAALVDDLFGHQAELTGAILATRDTDQVDTSLIDLWAEGRRTLVARTEQLLAELQAVANPNLAMLAVANRQLKSMSL